MTQRKLFVGALALTLALGALFFVSSSSIQADTKLFNPNFCATPKYRKNHPAKCKRVTPSPSNAATPSTASTPSGQASGEPQDGSSPSPDGNPVTTGSPVALIQLPAKVFPRPLPASTKTPIRIDLAKNAPTDNTWKKYFKQILPDSTNAKRVLWHNFAAVHVGNKNTVTNQTVLTSVVGARAGTIDSNYYISQPFATTDVKDPNLTTFWQTFTFKSKAANTNQLQVSYRVSELGGTTDSNASDWIPIDIAYSTKLQQTSLAINRTGKYFQYKINIFGTKAQIESIGLLAQPAEAVVPSPTPSVSVSPSTNPTAGPSSSPVGGTGHITLQTRVLLDEESQSVTPTASNIPLPTLPSPSPSVLPSLPPKSTQYCNGQQDTDPVPNVAITVRRTPGGNPTVQDEQTDDDGIWHGIDGEVDEFPVGTYSVTFGDYQKQDYKLVALCVSPDDAQYYLKTQTNPNDKKATIFVVAGKETKVTALYALRTRPYLTMNKFAIAGLPDDTSTTRKVLRTVYPGQTFTYLIRYENTGGEGAKAISIYDVLPEQFELPADFADTAQEKYGYDVGIDTQGRTYIVKSLDSLKPGEKGSISIPVTLKADAFDTSSGTNP